MAGFFDDLGKRLSETANDLGKKAEDTLEIQKRKSDIRFLGRANDRDYMDIGKIIFEKYRNGDVYKRQVHTKRSIRHWKQNLL